MTSTILLNDRDFEQSPSRLKVLKELRKLNIPIQIHEMVSGGNTQTRIVLVSTWPSTKTLWNHIELIFKNNAQKELWLAFDDSLTLDPLKKIKWFSVRTGTLIRGDI